MTEKHKELTYRSISWMNSRVTGSGMRWATEFPVTQGWVADLAIFTFPQERFFRQLKPKPEPQEKLLYIFESKASKSDFNKSFSGKHDTHKLNPIGNVHYVVTSKNLVKPEEIPKGWGWLMQSGNGLREMIRPEYFIISEEFKHEMGWRMLWTAYGHRASIEDWELRQTQLF